MVDESIRQILNNKSSDKLDFKRLLEFMDSSGIDFKDRRINGALGIATFYCIYLDINIIDIYDDKYLYFIILHEMAHYKRISKFGKERMIEMLSLECFDEFCEHVIGEEIIADRYACLVYQIFNKISYPRQATQQLHLWIKQLSYKSSLRRDLYGVVKNSEENYMRLIESFLE